MWNSKEYNRLKRIYAFSEQRKYNLYNLLEKMTDDIFSGKSTRIFEELMEEENKLQSKYTSRFVRNIAETPNYRVKNQRFPDMFKCQPEIIFPNEDEYSKYSDKQKMELEAIIYISLAITSARIANLYNRSKNSRQDALSQKNIYISDFLEFSSKYNSLVKEEDQILFGFKEDTRGAVLLESSLPGYTRFAVHFGSNHNFYNTLLAINRRLQKDGFDYAFPSFVGRDGKEHISNSVFNQYKYSIPKFGVTYNGIINRDEGNFSIKQLQEYEQVFQNCCKLPNGKLDKGGIEDFLYIYCEDIGESFNDREIFQLAERAGVGKKVLTTLKDVIDKRKTLKSNAKANNRSLMEEYIFSMNSKDFTDRIQKICNKSMTELYDFIDSIVVNLAFNQEDQKVNEKNLTHLLNMTKSSELRKVIFDVANIEYGEQNPPLKDILLEYVNNTSQKKTNLHDQMMRITNNVSRKDRVMTHDEENRLWKWLNSMER